MRLADDSVAILIHKLGVSWVWLSLKRESIRFEQRTFLVARSHI